MSPDLANGTDEALASCRVLITAIGSLSAEPVMASLRRARVASLSGCDIHPALWLPAARHLDYFRQVSMAANETDRYLHELADICESRRITHLVPLTDVEVDVLSANSEALPDGVEVCIPVNASLLRDKYEWFRALSAHSHHRTIPTTLYDGATSHPGPYPLVAKPRKGRSKQGFVRIETPEQMEAYAPLLSGNDYILQPYVKSPVYVADLLRDDSGGNVAVVCRKELTRTSNGAGLAVQLHPSRDLQDRAAAIAADLAIHGCVNMEFLEYDGSYALMDVNPRFSAGIGATIRGGYDMVANALRLHNKGRIEGPVEYSPAVFTRMIGIFEEIGRSDA